MMSGISTLPTPTPATYNAQATITVNKPPNSKLTNLKELSRNGELNKF